MLPAGIYGKLTDTYLATDNMIVSGRLKVGQLVIDEQTGKYYRFVQANAAIAANKSCKNDPGQNVEGIVIATAAATDAFDGVNETGGTVAALTYFFMTIRGPVSVLVNNAVAAGAIVAPSGVSGQLDVGSAAAVQILRCRTAVVSVGGATAAYLY